MKSARLTLAALGVLALAACTTDTTGPGALPEGAQEQIRPLRPSGPGPRSAVMGSGAREGADTTILVGPQPASSGTSILTPEELP